jgi:HTH domain.
MAVTRGPGVLREKVLVWARRGWSAPRIAAKLGVAKQTVYYHLHRLEEDGEIEGAVKVYRRRSA